MPIQIVTERLILRELCENDFDALYATLADSDIMRHYPYAFDEKRVRNWITKNIRRYRVLGFGLFAVTLKSTGEMIGDCGLTMQDINGFIAPEIGYHIRASHQRKGYAGEAASAVRDFAFSHTPFNEICSYMKADNLPSRKTAESWGATLQGTYIDGDNEETAVYVLTREDWRERFAKTDG